MVVARDWRADALQIWVLNVTHNVLSVQVGKSSPRMIAWRFGMKDHTKHLHVIEHMKHVHMSDKGFSEVLLYHLAVRGKMRIIIYPSGESTCLTFGFWTPPCGPLQVLRRHQLAARIMIFGPSMQKAKTYTWSIHSKSLHALTVDRVRWTLAHMCSLFQLRWQDLANVYSKAALHNQAWKALFLHHSCKWTLWAPLRSEASLLAHAACGIAAVSVARAEAQAGANLTGSRPRVYGSTNIHHASVQSRSV